ncbi:hypothetical protein BS78_01G073600 [Paspalum vaginatum]|nr:hypothetical protein BS78_01G073600 [Paspalum vaginatum]
MSPSAIRSPSSLFCASPDCRSFAMWRSSAERSAAKGGAPRANPSAVRFLPSFSDSTMRRRCTSRSGIDADCGWLLGQAPIGRAPSSGTSPIR